MSTAQGSYFDEIDHIGPDNLNNVESVYLPGLPQGSTPKTLDIQVFARSIRIGTYQSFSLVVTGNIGSGSCDSASAPGPPRHSEIETYSVVHVGLPDVCPPPVFQPPKEASKARIVLVSFVGTTMGTAFVGIGFFYLKKRRLPLKDVRGSHQERFLDTRLL